MTQAYSPRQAASVWFIQLRENPQDESLKAGFEAWLAQAPEHAQAWASINRAAGVMNRMAGETSPVPHAVSLPAFRSVRPGWACGRKAGAVLAVGMAACVAGLFFGFDLPLRWQADQYAPAAQMRTVQLADGSSILLAPLSAIRVEASGGGRTITLLRGEALFTVKHDPARPFSVKAGAVTATDIGTVFDVARTAQGANVAVREGASRVETAGPAPEALELGSGAWVRVAGPSVQRGTEPPGHVGLWSEGLLMVENTTIAALAESMRPWQPGYIVVLDKDLARQTVSGVYDLHHPVEALQLAVRQHGGHVHRLSRWLTVISRS